MSAESGNNKSPLLERESVGESEPQMEGSKIFATHEHFEEGGGDNFTKREFQSGEGDWFEKHWVHLKQRVEKVEKLLALTESAKVRESVGTDPSGEAIIESKCSKVSEVDSNEERLLYMEQRIEKLEKLMLLRKLQKQGRVGK